VYVNIQTMKLHRHYIFSIIIVMLASMSHDMATPMHLDTHSETNIEISLEEKGSKTKLDEKLITNDLVFSLKGLKAFSVFDCSIPIVDQLYLNNIFKPPIIFS